MLKSVQPQLISVLSFSIKEMAASLRRSERSFVASVRIALSVISSLVKNLAS